MPHEVKKTRVIPNQPGHKHAGKQAALVMCESGYRAWGFGNTKAEARKNGVSKVNELKRRAAHKDTMGKLLQR